MPDKIIYVVEMLRWGDTESHHYIIGSFDNPEDANAYGDAEVSWRGGKYEYRVVQTILNHKTKEIMDYHNGCTNAI